MKHAESVGKLQSLINDLIDLHGQDLCISVTLAIDPQGKSPTVQQFQWGIKDLMVLLLKETLQKTEREADSFIGVERKFN